MFVIAGHHWSVSWLLGHFVTGTTIRCASISTLGISQGDLAHVYIYYCFIIFIVISDVNNTKLSSPTPVCFR